MRVTVHIQNLKCGDCEKAIINKLSQLKSISDVHVNQDEETVSFEHFTTHDFDTAKYALSRIGYPIVGKESRIRNKAK